MSEHLSIERHEIEPRAVTGLFQLHAAGVPLEFSPEGKAMPVRNELRFAVKEVLVRHTTAGWREFTEILATHVSGVEAELLRDSRLYSVAESPIDELTDMMMSGEIRLVDPEEYRAAYLRKYGDVIQGPMFW